jgi:ATP-dependent Clp protease ATP-binding subunit ClpC
VDVPTTVGLVPKVKNVCCKATSLGHDYVGTEHMLMGLCRLKDGAAVRVIANLGLKPDAVRQAVLACSARQSLADGFVTAANFK